MKEAEPQTQGETLSRQVMKGGSYLVIRRATAVALGLFGTLFLTRVVGPNAYGIFASAFGVFRFLSLVGDLGAQMYILRSPPDTPRRVYEVGLWWMLVSSTVVAAISILLIYFALHSHFDNQIVKLTFIAVILNLPLSQASQVALIHMERNLEYRKVATVEIVSQILYYIVGILLAYYHCGVWAFVGAFWASQTAQSLGYFWLSNLKFRMAYDRETLRSIVKNGARMGISLWVYELRLLIPAFVLLPLAGERAAGHYALATRLVNSLGFARDAIWRLSIPLLARFQNDTKNLIQIVQISSVAQIVSQSIVFFVITQFGNLVLPLMLGQQWQVGELISVFAAWAICMNFFSFYEMKKQALLVKNKPEYSAIASSIYVLLSFASSWVLLSHSESKLLVFTLAVTLSYIPYFAILHYAFSRHIGKSDFETTVLLNIILSSFILSPIVGYHLMLLNSLLLVPRFREKLIAYIKKFRVLTNRNV